MGGQGQFQQQNPNYPARNNYQNNRQSNYRGGSHVNMGMRDPHHHPQNNMRNQNMQQQPMPQPQPQMPQPAAMPMPVPN